MDASGYQVWKLPSVCVCVGNRYVHCCWDVNMILSSGVCSNKLISVHGFVCSVTVWREKAERSEITSRRSSETSRWHFTRFNKDTHRISESSRTRVEDEDQCYCALLNRSISGHYIQHALQFILSLGHLTFNLWWCSRSRSLRRTWVLLSSMTNSSSRLSGSRRSSIRARGEMMKKAGWRGALSLSKSR